MTTANHTKWRRTSSQKPPDLLVSQWQLTSLATSHGSVPLITKEYSEEQTWLIYVECWPCMDPHMFGHVAFTAAIHPPGIWGADRSDTNLPALLYATMLLNLWFGGL
jgi:hypothetical protein